MCLNFFLCGFENKFLLLLVCPDYGSRYSHFMYAVIKVEYYKTGGLDTIYQTPVDFSFRLPGSYIVENSVGIEEEVRI